MYGKYCTEARGCVAPRGLSAIFAIHPELGCKANMYTVQHSDKKTLVHLYMYMYQYSPHIVYVYIRPCISCHFPTVLKLFCSLLQAYPHYNLITLTTCATRLGSFKFGMPSNIIITKGHAYMYIHHHTLIRTHTHTHTHYTYHSSLSMVEGLALHISLQFSAG